jgi:hypothetical protein
MNKDESRIHELVSTLNSSATGKVAAIKSFEKYFFESKPSRIFLLSIYLSRAECSVDLITVLYNGIENHGG